MEYNNGYSSSLVHSQGAWKKHKYTGKITKGGNTYYLYGSQGLMNRSSAARMNLKQGRMSKPKEKEEEKKEKKPTIQPTIETKPVNEKKVKEKAAKGGGSSSKPKETKSKQEKVVEKKPEKVYTMVEGKNKKAKEYLERYASKRKYSKEEVDKIKEQERLKRKRR